MNNQRLNGLHPRRMRLAAAALCCVALSGCSHQFWAQYHASMEASHAKAAEERHATYLREQAYDLMPGSERLACVQEGRMAAANASNPTVFVSRRHPGQAFGATLAAGVIDGIASGAAGNEAQDMCLRIFLLRHIEAGDIVMTTDEQLIWTR